MQGKFSRRAGLFLLLGACGPSEPSSSEASETATSTGGATANPTSLSAGSAGGESSEGDTASRGDVDDGSSSSSSSSSGSGSDPGFPNEVWDGIYRLDGVSGDLGFVDLAPLHGMVEGASIVGLGESTHTADAFLAGKARLTRYLVAEEGFRVIGLETPEFDMRPLQEYIQSCSGVPATIVPHAMFQVWADIHMVDLAIWLCEWNAEHPDDPVDILGWDHQQPWHDGTMFEQAVAAVDPASVSTVYGDLESCNGVQFASFEEYIESPEAGVWAGANPDEEAHTACLAALPVAKAWIADHAEQIAAWSSEDGLWRVEGALRGIEAWEGSSYNNGSDLRASYESRDLANAQTILELRDRFYPDDAMVLWAHNAHLLRDSTTLVGGLGLSGAEMTGTRLAAELESDYVSLGLIGYDIDLTWFEPFDGPPADSPASLERALLGFDEDYLLVDLRHEPSALPEGQSFDVGHPTQGVEPMIPAQQFDGLLFVAQSPGMTPVFP